MALGPWNAPPNFIGAMSAGASAGLQARGQDIAQSEAGDRLTLAYNQLASEERQRNEAAKQRIQAAQQMMAYRQHQLSLLDQYRQQRIAEQKAALAEKAREAGLPKLHFGTAGEVLSEQGGQVTELRPARPASVRPSPFDTNEHANIIKQITDNEKLIDAAQLPGEADRLRNKNFQLHQRAREIESKYAQPPIPKVASKEDHSKLAPGATYIGPDGKTYRKKGQPTTEDANAE